MVSIQSGSSQPLTKLMILQHAVNVITTLEQQVRGRYSYPAYTHCPFVSGSRTKEMGAIGQLCKSL